MKTYFLVLLRKGAHDPIFRDWFVRRLSLYIGAAYVPEHADLREGRTNITILRDYLKASYCAYEHEFYEPMDTNEDYWEILENIYSTRRYCFSAGYAAVHIEYIHTYCPYVKAYEALVRGYRRQKRKQRERIDHIAEVIEEGKKSLGDSDEKYVNMWIEGVEKAQQRRDARWWTSFYVNVNLALETFNRTGVVTEVESP